MRYQRRERRLAQATTHWKLYRTQQFDAGETMINLPWLSAEDRQDEFACEFSFRIENSASEGVMLQIGGELRALCVWVEPGGILGLGVGHKEAINPVGLQYWTQGFRTVSIGADYQCAVAARAADGQARLWLNGRRCFALQAGRESFFNTDSQFAGGGDGGFFATINPVSNVAFNKTTPVVDLTSLGPLTYYKETIPWHFGEADTDGPDPERVVQPAFT